MSLCSYPVNDPADEFGPRMKRCPAFGALVNLSLPPVSRPHRREVMRTCAQAVSDQRASETEQPFRIGRGDDDLAQFSHPRATCPLAWFSRSTTASASSAIFATSLHSLGHYFATLLIHSGASVKRVQLALGHSTPTITLNTYVGEWPDTDWQTRSIVDAALGRVPPDVP